MSSAQLHEALRLILSHARYHLQRRNGQSRQTDLAVFNPQRHLLSLTTLKRCLEAIQMAR